MNTAKISDHSAISMLSGTVLSLASLFGLAIVMAPSAGRSYDVILGLVSAAADLPHIKSAQGWSLAYKGGQTHRLHHHRCQAG